MKWKSIESWLKKTVRPLMTLVLPPDTFCINLKKNKQKKQLQMSLQIVGSCKHIVETCKCTQRCWLGWYWVVQQCHLMVIYSETCISCGDGMEASCLNLLLLKQGNTQPNWKLMLKLLDYKGWQKRKWTSRQKGHYMMMSSMYRRDNDKRLRYSLLQRNKDYMTVPGN